MKKIVCLLLVAIVVIVLFGCNDEGQNPSLKQKQEQETSYRVIIDTEHTDLCEVKSSYKAREEVVIKLPTITEHYYRVFTNGVEVEMDNRSDMVYTYYVFTMPDGDVNLEIKDYNVEIPASPQG